VTELDELIAIRAILNKLLALEIVKYNQPDTKAKLDKEQAKPTT
jgi:hypothetical protein